MSQEQQQEYDDLVKEHAQLVDAIQKLEDLQAESDAHNHLLQEREALRSNPNKSEDKDSVNFDDVMQMHKKLKTDMSLFELPKQDDVNEMFDQLKETESNQNETATESETEIPEQEGCVSREELKFVLRCLSEEFGMEIEYNDDMLIDMLRMNHPEKVAMIYRSLDSLMELKREKDNYQRLIETGERERNQLLAFQPEESKPVTTATTESDSESENINTLNELKREGDGAGVMISDIQDAIALSKQHGDIENQAALESLCSDAIRVRSQLKEYEDRLSQLQELQAALREQEQLRDTITLLKESALDPPLEDTESEMESNNGDNENEERHPLHQVEDDITEEDEGEEGGESDLDSTVDSEIMYNPMQKVSPMKPKMEESNRVFFGDDFKENYLRKQLSMMTDASISTDGSISTNDTDNQMTHEDEDTKSEASDVTSSTVDAVKEYDRMVSKLKRMQEEADAHDEWDRMMSGLAAEDSTLSKAEFDSSLLKRRLAASEKRLAELRVGDEEENSDVERPTTSRRIPRPSVDQFTDYVNNDVVPDDQDIDMKLLSKDDNNDENLIPNGPSLNQYFSDLYKKTFGTGMRQPPQAQSQDDVESMEAMSDAGGCVSADSSIAPDTDAEVDGDLEEDTQNGLNFSSLDALLGNFSIKSIFGSVDSIDKRPLLRYLSAHLLRLPFSPVGNRASTAMFVAEVLFQISNLIEEQQRLRNDDEYVPSGENVLQSFVHVTINLLAKLSENPALDLGLQDMLDKMENRSFSDEDEDEEDSESESEEEESSDGDDDGEDDDDESSIADTVTADEDKKMGDNISTPSRVSLSASDIYSPEGHYFIEHMADSPNKVSIAEHEMKTEEERWSSTSPSKSVHFEVDECEEADPCGDESSVATEQELDEIKVSVTSTPSEKRVMLRTPIKPINDGDEETRNVPGSAVVKRKMASMTEQKPTLRLGIASGVTWPTLFHNQNKIDEEENEGENYDIDDIIEDSPDIPTMNSSAEFAACLQLLERLSAEIDNRVSQSSVTIFLRNVLSTLSEWFISQVLQSESKISDIADELFCSAVRATFLKHVHSSVTEKDVILEEIGELLFDEHLSNTVQQRLAKSYELEMENINLQSSSLETELQNTVQNRDLQLYEVHQEREKRLNAMIPVRNVPQTAPQVSRVGKNRLSTPEANSLQKHLMQQFSESFGQGSSLNDNPPMENENEDLEDIDDIDQLCESVVKESPMKKPYWDGLRSEMMSYALNANDVDTVRLLQKNASSSSMIESETDEIDAEEYEEETDDDTLQSVSTDISRPEVNVIDGATLSDAVELSHEGMESLRRSLTRMHRRQNLERSPMVEGGPIRMMNDIDDVDAAIDDVLASSRGPKITEKETDSESDLEDVPTTTDDDDDDLKDEEHQYGQYGDNSDVTDDEVQSMDLEEEYTEDNTDDDVGSVDLESIAESQTIENEIEKEIMGLYVKPEDIVKRNDSAQVTPIQDRAPKHKETPTRLTNMSAKKNIHDELIPQDTETDDDTQSELSDLPISVDDSSVDNANNDSSRQILFDTESEISRSTEDEINQAMGDYLMPRKESLSLYEQALATIHANVPFMETREAATIINQHPNRNPVAELNKLLRTQAFGNEFDEESSVGDL
eukprot:TRINITY_DN11899_c0_g2_i1.p1 TRINITY_DN11899_c0_g2~~TRINITY_DN11899_c0_g2_i1.p1  ORF type:complete len:1625 (+),score=768.94 TRINITY_DN11899_c0_g2_i1:147-5021(+)